jgi:hypothetical protein
VNCAPVGLAFDHGGDVVSHNGLLRHGLLISRPQTILEVRHDPGARSGAVPPAFGVAEVYTTVKLILQARQKHLVVTVGSGGT